MRSITAGMLAEVGTVIETGVKLARKRLDNRIDMCYTLSVVGQRCIGTCDETTEFRDFL